MSSLKPGLCGDLALWGRDPAAPVMAGSVAAMLRRRGREDGARTALIWRSGDGLARMSYAELLAAAEKAARWILSHAAPGDRVAVWARNGWEWVVVEHACALSGTIITPWNTAWTDHEARHAIALTDPRIILAEADTRGVDLMARARALGEGRTVAHLFELPKLQGADVALPDPGPEAPFLVQFTSGTTGRAKGALHTQGSALNGGFLRVWDGGGADDVFLNAAPLHHVGGSISLVLGALACAGAYALMPRFEPGEFIRLIKETGATRTGGVPTMLIAIMEHPDFPPEGFHLRGLGCGATQVPTPLIRKMAEVFHAPILNTFGQSECGFITCTVAGDDPELVAVTVGRPAPQNDVRIADPATGETLRQGEVGEICARSPAQMRGYFDQPEATAATIDAEGWLHTGDLGVMDARGYVTVKGRAREVIIRGGENIYPIEVEQVLMQHPGVAQVAAVGVPDPRWGHEVGAAIRRAEGSGVSQEELDAFVRERLAHFKAPRHWLFLDAIPMTSSGKVRKVELEAMFAEGRSSSNTG
jgi:fatty-acyl-CoA synthase